MNRTHVRYRVPSIRPSGGTPSTVRMWWSHLGRFLGSATTFHTRFRGASISTEASTTLTTARRSSRRRPAGPSPPPYDPGWTQPNQRGVFHRILRRAGQTDALSQLGGASSRLPQRAQRRGTPNDHAGHVGGSPRRGLVQGEGGGDLVSCARELGQHTRHDRLEGTFGGHPPQPNRHVH